MEPKFEHPALEQDIERLAVEIREQKAVDPERQKEIIKRSLGGYIQESWSAGKPPAGAQPSVLPNYLQDAPADVKFQVEKLLDLAWHKGITIAIKEAKKAGALILDAFHDAITDKFYNELKSRGYIK